MKHRPLASPVHRAGNSHGRILIPQSNTFEAYVEQAELCCEQARGALRCQRFGAARGLLATATALYQRALSSDGIAYAAVENRLRDIEQEIQLAAESAKYMTGLSCQR